MGKCPQKNEEVPDEMSELEPVKSIENNPNRIGNPTDEDEPKRFRRQFIERTD